MEPKQDIPKVLNRLSQEKSHTMLGSFSTKYDPWHILIGTILSARSKDEVTEPLCEELFKHYPNAKALANANSKDVERMIKRIGFYRNKTKHIIATSKIILEKYHGKVPETMEELLHLPGVGRKVAGCVLVYAHSKDAIPVDTHVHRVSNRLGWVKTKKPEQTEQALMKLVPKKYWQVVNDYLVWHGKTTCKPITPECSRCVVRKWCKRVGVKRWK
ncbi:endonuclease III [Candidatus Woesearchaeota archaeon]|nr:endonuclease III [Candidatus Woesearchaeota archaeon]